MIDCQMTGLTFYYKNRGDKIICWMLVKQAGKQVNFKNMDKAQEHNDDGYGVSWYEDDRVKTYKSFNYNTFKGVVAALKQHTIVVHLRYATRGLKDYNNIHPFEVPSGVMYHNGTMFGLGDAITSDSQELADTISECDYKYIEDIAPLIKPYIDDKINRLVFFEDNGQITIMNENLGIIDEEDGTWYSNTYHLKDEGWCRPGTKKTKKEEKKKEMLELRDLKRHKVFVYGTLKRGYSNHALLAKATYLGKAKTTLKWTMIGKGMSFPYVIEQHDELGMHVAGEVYVVDDMELAHLNRLEGVPYHYKVNRIKVNYTDTLEEETVTMYTKTHYTNNYTEKNTLIAEWHQA